MRRLHMSSRAMRESDVRAARMWAAKRALMHEKSMSARRRGGDDVVALVLPALHGAPGWTEWRGQLSFPAAMRDEAIRAGTLMRDPYEHLY